MKSDALKTENFIYQLGVCETPGGSVVFRITQNDQLGQNILYFGENDETAEELWRRVKAREWINPLALDDEQTVKKQALSNGSLLTFRMIPRCMGKFEFLVRVRLADETRLIYRGEVRLHADIAYDNVIDRVASENERKEIYRNNPLYGAF